MPRDSPLLHTETRETKKTSVGASSHSVFLSPSRGRNTLKPPNPRQKRKKRAHYGPRISVPALCLLGEAPGREGWEQAAGTTRVCCMDRPVLDHFPSPSQRPELLPPRSSLSSSPRVPSTWGTRAPHLQFPPAEFPTR